MPEPINKPKVYVYSNGIKYLIPENNIKKLPSIYWIIIKQLNCSELNLILNA